jgi:hypothetical protein
MSRNKKKHVPSSLAQSPIIMSASVVDIQPLVNAAVGFAARVCDVDTPGAVEAYAQSAVAVAALLSCGIDTSALFETMLCPHWPRNTPAGEWAAAAQQAGGRVTCEAFATAFIVPALEPVMAVMRARSPAMYNPVLGEFVLLAAQVQDTRPQAATCAAFLFCILTAKDGPITGYALDAASARELGCALEDRLRKEINDPHMERVATAAVALFAGDASNAKVAAAWERLYGLRPPLGTWRKHVWPDSKALFDDLASRGGTRVVWCVCTRI